MFRDEITHKSNGGGQVVVFKLVEWLREEGVHLLPPPDTLPASHRPAPEVASEPLPLPQSGNPALAQFTHHFHTKS